MANTIGTGRRNICDLSLRGCQEDVRSLEPGDIVLAKTTQNPLSNTIAKLDGWWSHSALAVDKNRVVHSNARGITIDSLGYMRSHYPQGLAVVRPDLPTSTRFTATRWALHKASVASGYGADQLGLAFSLLWRLGRQPAAAELEKIVRDEELGPQTQGDGQAPAYQSTCSGFVYQSYLYGAGVRLDFTPAPGMRVLDDMLWAPDRGELLDELRQIRSEPLRADTKRLATIGLRGVRSAVRALRLDEPVPIEVAITPSDVWMSPGQRWFVQGHRLAVRATHHC